MRSRISKYLPILQWLPNYRREFLRGDISAGLTVGVMLIPQGMAYAMLAGMPPIYGLYAGLVPILLYAVFGTSRQLAVGPVAMISLLVAAGVGALAEAGSESYVLLAITLSMIVGIVQITTGVLRLGFLVNFLSQPVIAGFTSAAALIIGLSQLKHLLGINLSGSTYVHEILIATVQKVGDISWLTFLVGIGGMAIIMTLKRVNKRIPGALAAVIFGIGLVYLTGWYDQGVKIVGTVPEGLPSFQIPDLDPKTWQILLPTALTIAMVSFMESISVGKAIQARHRGEYEIDANQELIALGFANFSGSLFQAYPVDGGFSRSAVNDQAGARTGLAGIITAVMIGLTLLFLTPLFFYLPNAILASIIMVAVFGLINIKEARRLWREDRKDFSMLLFTFAATLALGIIQGILVGVVLSLVLVIYKSAYPHVAIQGRIPGTTYFRNIARFPEAELDPSTAVIRFDAPLYFANANYFRDQVRKLEAKRGDGLRLLILNAESIHSIDSTAVGMLEQLLLEWRESGREFALAGAIGPVRDALHKTGLLQKIGEDKVFAHVHDAVAALAQDAKGHQDSRRLALQTDA